MEPAYIMPSKATQEKVCKKEFAESLCKNALKDLSAEEAIEVLDSIRNDVLHGHSSIEWGMRERHSSIMY